jgi:hypothetical protein
MSVLPPSTTWQEVIAADEAERFLHYALQLQQMQRARAQSGRIRRALHAKQLLGARAEFKVLPELPEYARVGLFAAPTTYPAWVRFSNGSGGMQSDHKGDVRGFAVKLIGVEGRKIIPGLEDARTQDFLMIHTASIPFRNTAEFIAFALGAANPLTLLPKVWARFGFRRLVQILKTVPKAMGQPIPTLAGHRFYSALPIKFGAYAVHYSAQPVTAPDPPQSLSTSADYLLEDLQLRLQKGPISYDFKVQFYCDPARTPIEDASVEWREEDAPFITVARLTLPQQDLSSAEGKRQTEYVERLSFDPWHAGEDFRPLGDIMRARNHAYRVSTMTRSAAKEPVDANLPPDIG